MRPPACRGPHRSPAHWLDFTAPNWPTLSAPLTAVLIAMRDEPRPDAREAAAQLKRLGITSIILTGDNERTAAAITGGLGMEFRAGMMPEDKLDTLNNLADFTVL